MSNGVSETVMPAVLNMLTVLDHMAGKAKAACAAGDVEESVYLDWRVAPDMLPLTKQLRFASEIPARGLARLAGAEIPSFADNELSFDDFKARFARAREMIGALDAGALDRAPDEDITVPAGQIEMTMPRRVYADQWLLPNMYFHVTTAYLILRGLGVDLGKRDFLLGLAPYFPKG